MIHIYVLELQEGKYYVGRSTCYQERVLDHFRGEGSEWTRKYPPVRVVEIYHGDDVFEEDKLTKKYMALHGIENVRGGVYCQLQLDSTTLTFLERELRGAMGKCLRCGKGDHWVRDCREATDVHGEPLTPVRENLIDRYFGERCERCGRRGHTLSKCRAATHLNGEKL